MVLWMCGDAPRGNNPLQVRHDKFGHVVARREYDVACFDEGTGGESNGSAGATKLVVDDFVGHQPRTALEGMVQKAMCHAYGVGFSRSARYDGGRSVHTERLLQLRP